jgi:hypothetical protein
VAVGIGRVDGVVPADSDRRIGPTRSVPVSKDPSALNAVDTRNLGREPMGSAGEISLRIRLSEVVIIRIVVVITVLLGAGTALPWLM